ncbi:MAG: glycosyltransferase family 39 protein [Chloroflexi bacterium]|nr:glycosyltransferase family 39 protein [Chloroflexota bacterium]
MTDRPPLSHKLSLHALAALGLCLFAFVMSAVISRTTFERLPHLEDEYAYLFQARTLARGDLVIETPQPRRAFWQPFVLDRNGNRFGKYTPGWPMLLAGGSMVGQEWIVNASLAALTVAVVYALGRDLFGRDTGLIGAALAAFSPMALLLNATLMGHTSALFAGVLALYAYLRLERALTRKHPDLEAPVEPARMPSPVWTEEEEAGAPASPVGTTTKLRLPGSSDLTEGMERTTHGSSLRPSPFVWALVCGLALGLLAANRPLTGAAFALPLVARAGAWLLGRWTGHVGGFWPWLRPHLVIAAAALALFATVPLYNTAAIGNPTANLYTLVWSYDCVGFEGCGRSGHTLEKGFRHARFDLTLTAADLFGWQAPLTLTNAAREHLINEGDTYPSLGLSWVLLPFGLLIGLRRRWWLAVVWGAFLAAAYALVNAYGPALLTEPRVGWAWVIGVALWTLIPVVWLRDRRAVWTWILLTTAVLVIDLQLAYWIGSQRYSTRYYFEGLAGAALLSALPLGALIRRIPSARPLVYGLLGGLLLIALTVYTLPRIDLLRGYNRISQAQIREVNARREGDRQVLVLVTGGDVRWRAYGPLMASTSPYLDSPIVAAWDYSNGGDPAVRQAILDRFPDRQVIEMGAEVNDSWFMDDPPP